MIRLRFVWGYDALSTTIRLFEHDGDSPTHVDSVLPDGRLLGAHISGGVQIRDPGYDAAPHMRELFVNAPLVAAWKYQAGWEAFLRAQVGKPYDTTAIVGLALDRDWREDDSWFCSEMAAAALEECGYLCRLSTINQHVSPRDLLMVVSGMTSVSLPEAR